MLIPTLLTLTGYVLLVLLGISGYAAWVAHKMTVMERVPVDGHPSQLDLDWEDVTFPSRGDRVSLSGWYLTADAQVQEFRSLPGFAGCAAHLSTKKKSFRSL